MDGSIGGFLPLSANAPIAQPRRDSAESKDSRKVAEDFSGLFTSLIVKQMLDSVESEEGKGPFGSGPGADIYRGLAESALSEALAKSGMGSLTDRIQDLIDNHPAIEEVKYE